MPWPLLVGKTNVTATEGINTYGVLAAGIAAMRFPGHSGGTAHHYYLRHQSWRASPGKIRFSDSTALLVPAEHELSFFHLSVADLLRGDYKQSEYGRVVAHTTMSKQALDSERVRNGLKDVLPGPAQLYQALGARDALSG